MSGVPSRRRQLAQALVRHAVRVLPASRSSWADAMAHEMAHIEGDWEALRWALGCMLASYVEKSRLADVLRTPIARILLSLFIAAEAVNMLFASVLTAAYRFQYLKIAAWMGGFTPGDDYRRFIPLMDATPLYLHALWVLASALFAASAWQILRDSRLAFPLFATAWLLSKAGDLISLSMPLYRQVFSFPEPMFTRDYLLPAATSLFPVLVAIALLAHRRWSTLGGPTES